LEQVSTKPNTINLVVYALEDFVRKISPIFKENEKLLRIVLSIIEKRVNCIKLLHK